MLNAWVEIKGPLRNAGGNILLPFQICSDNDEVNFRTQRQAQLYCMCKKPKPDTVADFVFQVGLLLILIDQMN